MMDKSSNNYAQNQYSNVAFASLIGSAVEFYDFYIFSIFSATFLGSLFFSFNDSSKQIMYSFLTFGIAFIARPMGSIIFGHFGDIVGRKSTLVFSLIIMGTSTTLIGFLPVYSQVGFISPILLCLLRFGQGIGLGGEWGGAALLATENAPEGKRAIFAMFPQLGPPIGFILASSSFLILKYSLSYEQIYDWGWRIPFIFSFVLIILGLYVRLSIIESPAFQKLEEINDKSKVPFLDVIKYNFKQIILGSLAGSSCFILFFIITVFALQYETANHFWLEKPFFSYEVFLIMLMVAICFMALSSPISAYLSDKYGRKPTLIMSGIFTIIVSLFFNIFNSGNFFLTLLILILGLFAMGLLFTPMAAFLPEIFPAKMRYTGASLTFSISSILGGSLTPFFAAVMTNNNPNGIIYIKLYCIIGSIISCISVFFLQETKDVDILN